MRVGRPGQRRRPPAFIGGEWFRIIIMGVFLAVLMFVFLFEGIGGQPDSTERVVLPPSLPPAQLYTPDADILAKAKDSTRRERLLRDQEPFEHLLEKSLVVVPDVARALGMPQQPLPIELLRTHPERYRGDYLWYKGVLEALSPGKPGHPVPQYEIYEGRLRTESGAQVMFAFSQPPPEGLQIGRDWVRIEGFFLKLRDDHFPVIDQAPVLIGPELMRSLPDWEAVELLDHSVLSRVRDGNTGGTITDEQDMPATLAESQDVPLWHLASFAMHQEQSANKTEWQATPALTTADQWRALEFGEVDRGTPFRLLGTFQIARTLAAKTNPLGIESWTEAWIQSRDLGGRTIPIWIPNELRDDWRRNHTVRAHGYFFKRYLFTAQNGERRYAPVFVAAGLERFSLSRNLLNNNITWAFAGLVSIVGAVFFFMARRDRGQRLAHEKELVDRRRRRRGMSTAGQEA